MRDRIRATSAREAGPAESGRSGGNRAGGTYSEVLLRGQKDTSAPQSRGIPANGGRR